MMKPQQPNIPGTRPGLMIGLAGIVKNMVGLLVSRLELTALELSEVRHHLLKLALIFALGVMAVWFAVGYGTAAIVFLTWESMRWQILPVIAVVFTVLAIGLFVYACSIISKGALSLPETMAELRRDREAFSNEVTHREESEI